MIVVYIQSIYFKNIYLEWRKWLFVLINFSDHNSSSLHTFSLIPYKIVFSQSFDISYNREKICQLMLRFSPECRGTKHSSSQSHTNRKQLTADSEPTKSRKQWVAFVYAEDKQSYSLRYLVTKWKVFPSIPTHTHVQIIEHLQRVAFSCAANLFCLFAYFYFN